MKAKELREQFSNELGLGKHGWSLITEAAYLVWIEKKYIDHQAKSKEEIGKVASMHPYKQGARENFYEYAEGWTDACDELAAFGKEGEG